MCVDFVRGDRVNFEESFEIEPMYPKRILFPVENIKSMLVLLVTPS